MIARMAKKLKRLSPQLAALALILAANTIIAPGFLGRTDASTEA
jgi:simple sugar transport system permease protein